MPTQEAAAITLKTCKSICSDIKCISCSSWLESVYGNGVTSHMLGNDFNLDFNGGCIGK